VIYSVVGLGGSPASCSEVLHSFLVFAAWQWIFLPADANGGKGREASFQLTIERKEKKLREKEERKKRELGGERKRKRRKREMERGRKGQTYGKSTGKKFILPQTDIANDPFMLHSLFFSSPSFPFLWFLP